MRVLACCWMVVAAAAAAAQRSEAELRASLLRAFRAIDAPESQGFADLDAVHAELVRLEDSLGALAERRRKQTRFFLAVRRADVRLRQRRTADARRELTAAIPRARDDGVWSGSFRTHAVVIAAECFGERSRAELLASERAHLLADATLAEARWLEVPLRLLRIELALADGRDREGMIALETLATEVRDRRPAADTWRTKAIGQFAWELLVRGDLTRAERWFRELPASFRRHPIGLIALRRGDHELAERAGRALLRTGRKLQGAQLLGEALEEQGRVEEALAVYRDLVEHAESGLDAAIARRSLGDCELALWRRDADPARLAAARTHYAEALAAAGDGPAADAERVQLLARIGEVHERSDELDAAREQYLRSLSQADRTRAGLATGALGRTWLRDGRHLWAVDGMLRLAERGAPGVDAWDALAAIEVGRARTLLDWTVDPPRTGAGDALTRSLSRLLVADAPGAIDARLAELDALMRGGGAGGVTRTARPADAARLRDHVAGRSDRAFVTFWLGTASAYAIVARRGAARVIRLGPAERARRLAAAARLVVATPPGPDPDRDAAARALADAGAFFFAADVAQAVRSAAAVVLCPGPALEGAPFEAMPVGGEPLGLAWPIERAASLSIHRVLTEVAAGGERPGGILIVDPVEHTAVAEELGLEPLRFADREAGLVVRAYGEGRATRLRGTAATAAALTAELSAGRFDLVHVHAHGVLDTRVPTASMLLLSDGPALLPSLCAADLRGAFVVLSACSLGTGEVRAGEGNLALVGWPLAAGGRGAVAALWAVNQQASADLMGQFHAFRAAGHPEAEAMRRARGALAAAANYGHPYYWAGFGVWSASPRLSAGAVLAGSSVGWLSLGAGAALAAVVWRRRRRDARAT